MLTEKKIGRLIKQAREALNLTMDDMEHMLKGRVSASKICRLENGKHVFRETEDLLAILEFLGIPKERVL